MSLPPSEPKKKVSRYVIAAAVLLPFGFLTLLMFIPTKLPSALNILVIAFGIFALFASPALGFLGIRQIRRSEDAYSGMRLAVFLSLFYPIIVLDLILFTLGWSFLGSLSTSSLVPLAWLVIVILVDYWIVRVSWNRAIL